MCNFVGKYRSARVIGYGEIFILSRPGSTFAFCPSTSLYMDMESRWTENGLCQMKLGELCTGRAKLLFP